MIGYISGKIISKKPTKLLIDVGGIGYLVNISISTFEKIAELETVSLYTHLNVKEDALDLYGFYSVEEKEMFELLISVSGIGPKSAQSILSGIQIVDLIEALKTANVARLISIPGIGRKTAERMMIELRDKVDSMADTNLTGGLSQGGYRNDAITALVNLGYNQKVAEKTVRSILETNPTESLENIIKQSLSLLNN